MLLVPFFCEMARGASPVTARPQVATRASAGMCGITCCFGCLSVFGCKNCVARKLVFFPPPPKYAVEEREDGRQVMWLLSESGERVVPYSSRNFKVAFVPSKRTKGADICYFHISFPGATHTVFFSHGNAADLGCMRDHLLDLAVRLRVSVVAYDYLGYGLSGGKSSVEATIENADTMYAHCLAPEAEGGLGLREENIILYGQSLGSGPTCHLAALHRVAGVVLHAGLMSGLRVIKETPKTRFFDIFANVDLVHHATSPVFVIHGKSDEEIPVHHGEGLYDAVKPEHRYPPWYPQQAGHNNVEVLCRNEYFVRLQAFVDFCGRARSP